MDSIETIYEHIKEWAADNIGKSFTFRQNQLEAIGYIINSMGYWVDMNDPYITYDNRYIDSVARGVSVDAFWMDETEITNSKYKQFLYWVRDSIIRERLADPAYGGNEDFKIEEDKEGNPVKPHLDWSKNIPWKNPSEDEERAIESVYRTNPITGNKELDPEQMNYRYEVYNMTEAVKRKNRLDPTRRDLQRYYFR